MEDHIKKEMREDVALIMLNRPKSYNAFNLNMVRQLADVLIGLAKDPGVVGIVISGEGKAFCAGGDLAWIKDYGENAAAAFHELAARFHQAIMEMRRMPKPVVAAVNGFAAGGGFSLSLACDFRIMEQDAVLRQAYTSNGLSMDGGGTFHLPRLVGLAKALEIAAFDRSIDTEKAKAWGLVTKVVPKGESLPQAFDLIEDLKKGSLSSFAASKKLIYEAFETPLEQQLEKERELLAWCGDHYNGREGVAAFLEKRKPVFKKG